MSNSISLTVNTDDYNALIRVSEMLQGMAADLTVNTGITDCFNKKEKPAVVETKAPPAPPEKPAAIVETPTPAAVGDPILNAQPAVDLDSAGLPWDGRIHSAGKTKLVNGGTWKKIRKIDPALVEKVEAELRAAMAAPAPPETPAIVETTTPAATTIPPTPPAETTPPTPPAANAEPLTFPLFMSKVTNAMALGTLTDVMILEVVNKHGLASLPLLSARPDIIPAVDAELFPNG